MSKISENIRDMKEYIEEHGWTQGWFYDTGHPDKKDGPVCFLGARNAVLGFQVDDDEVNVNDDPIIQACRSYLGIHYSIHDWNDAEDRTKEEVLEMLENVAIKHESDESGSTLV